MPDKILLVEDEALIAIAEAAMLKKHGFIVSSAYSGEKALEAIASDTEISLVLMDIDLGTGMDGTETAKNILLLRELPIVFLTSHSEKEYVDRTEKISGYGYVLKNSGEFVLVESIRMAYKLFATYLKMKESEEKYRTAFMTSPDSININSFEGLYVDINEGFTALTGYNRDDVIGKLSSEIDIWTIPEDRKTLVKGLKEKGFVDNLESVFRCKDGTFKTALMSARLISLNGQPHILSITRDISEKKRIEDQLKSRERRWSAIFEQAADGILIGTKKGIISDANENMMKMTGYTRDELIGAPIEMLFGEQELAENQLEYSLVKEGATVQRERSIFRKDGILVPVIMNSKKIEDDCLQAIFHDVSNLRQAEKSLKESEERFRLAVEGSRDGLWDWNLETNEAFHSDRFATMLGYEPEELPYTSSAWSDLIHPDDREEAFQEVERYLSGKEEVYESLFRMKTKNGDYRWISGRGKAVFNSKGKPLRFVGFNTDITGIKKIEKTAEMAKRFLETISDIAYEADTRGHITYVNPAVEAITGFSVEELTGAPFLPLFREEDHSSLMEVYQRTLEGEILENELTFVNGATCHFTTLPRYDENGHICGTFGIGRDISERIHHEKEQQRSKELFRQMFMQHSAVQLLIDPGQNGRIVEANQAAADFYGYSLEQLRNLNIADINGLSAGEIEHIMKLVRTRSQNCFELTHRCADGRLKDVEVHSSPVLYNDSWVCFSIIRDISEQKQAQKELYAKNSYLSSILEHVPAIFYTFRIGEGGITHSAQVEKILGFSRRELKENPMLWHDSIQTEDRKRVDEAIRRGTEGENIDVVYRIRGNDQVWHWFHDVATPYSDENGTVGLHGVVIDISEQKERENELEHYREEYKSKLLLLERAEQLAQLGSWEWVLIDNSWSMSENWKRIHGLTETPVNMEELIKIAHPDDALRVTESLRRTQEDKSPYDIRHRIIRADNGEIRYIQALGVVEVEPGTNRALRIMGVAQDITERVTTEEKYKTIVQSSVDGILIIDPQGKVIEANEAYCKLIGISRQELLNMSVFDIEAIESEEKIRRHIEKLVQSGGDRFETRHRGNDGSLLDVEVSATPLPSGEGIVGIIRDISLRKEKEKQLQDSIQEKDLLMQELNHRVKNNLLMISSLIHLKDTSLGTKVDLSDLEHRIDTIRIIHENLNKGGDITAIDFHDYTEEILSNIFYFAPLPVRVENDIQDISMDTKRSVAVGLIINELATNAVKHGFSKDTPAVFRVQLLKEKDLSSYILKIGNTGNPFPEAIRFDRCETLGLQLITNLVKQLNGSLDVQRTPDTLFSIRFPV